MPGELPEQRPTSPEKPKDEERQRNYTPQNELGLPASKFSERVMEEALEDATGSWEKPNLKPSEDVGRVSSRSVQLVGIGFAVLLVLVIWIAFTFKAPKEQGQGKIEIVRGIDDIEPELQKKITDFLAAEDWNSVAHLVRGGDRIQEQLSLYQQRSPKVPVIVKSYRPLDVIMVRGDQFLYMLGYKDDNEKMASVYFTPEEPHHIIWEAFVAYGDGPYDALDSPTEGPEEIGSYRVYAEADGYYEGNYEKEVWQSIRLSYPSSDKQISAYVKRESTQAEKLKPLLNKRKGKVPLVLSIRPSVPGSSPEIIDLLGVGWHETGDDGPKVPNGSGKEE
ncbi:MAG: hypothetical protein VX577_06125 [Verrucomicrobiota bacterium]|nr:hypothetical protein [Verrucomicrobiota bacterium]